MAKWMTKPKTGGTLQGAIEYTGDRAGESHFQIYQDEKPFIEQAKICLLYTSPSPRDS